MNHHFVPRAASRSGWLAELSDALEEAQRLLAQLVAERIDQPDADLLRRRIEELRAELYALHRRGFGSTVLFEARRSLHPDWRARRD